MDSQTQLKSGNGSVRWQTLFIRRNSIVKVEAGIGRYGSMSKSAYLRTDASWMLVDQVVAGRPRSIFIMLRDKNKEVLDQKLVIDTLKGDGYCRFPVICHPEPVWATCPDHGRHDATIACPECRYR